MPSLAEPGRVGITGTSYGGYSAWWAITHFEPEIVAAAAPICGMTDLAIDYYATRPDLRPYSEEMMGGSPEHVPDRYRERSPINFVKNIKGELLIVQGLKDPNVTQDNVHAVAKALQRENVPYELLTFEDEGHSIARPRTCAYSTHASPTSSTKLSSYLPDRTKPDTAGRSDPATHKFSVGMFKPYMCRVHIDAEG